MKKNEEKQVATLPCLNSNCENCIWYLGNRECAAFQDKIPDEVWNGIHSKVLPNQAEPFIYNENGLII